MEQSSPLFEMAGTADYMYLILPYLTFTLPYQVRICTARPCAIMRIESKHVVTRDKVRIEISALLPLLCTIQIPYLASFSSFSSNGLPYFSSGSLSVACMTRSFSSIAPLGPRINMGARILSGIELDLPGLAGTSPLSQPSFSYLWSVSSSS